MVAGLQLIFLYLLGLSLFKAVLGFYSHGCEYRRFNKGMDLHCENSNLTTFIAPNTTNTSIHSIHLSGNLLKSFNGTEVSKICPNISMLDLKENNLKYVKNETLKGFLQLKLLDISHNNITEIDAGAFSNLMKLNKLHVRNNRIRIVKNVWFRNLSELEEIDLRYNLIDSFVPSDFRWPENLKILLLQGNRFHIVPPLPRNPDLVDLSDNKIDCSCQRLGQENVTKDVVSKVTFTCNEMSTAMWRKQHWENPFCTPPTVEVDYKAFNDVYIIKCAGDGFPPPKVSLICEEQVIVTIVQNPWVIYGLNNDTNVTCQASNPVGKIEVAINVSNHQEEVRIIQQEIIEKHLQKGGICKCDCECNFSLSYQDVPSNRLPMFYIFWYTIMFVSCAFTVIALIVSLCMFNFSFQQFHNTYETYMSI